MYEIIVNIAKFMLTVLPKYTKHVVGTLNESYAFQNLVTHLKIHFATSCSKIKFLVYTYIFLQVDEKRSMKQVN